MSELEEAGAPGADAAGIPSKERLVSPQVLPGEEAQRQSQRTLRPSRLEEYVGQEAVCEQMKIFILAARRREEPLDHTLLFGPPGLGKTTLAGIIANEMQAALHATSGPVMERAGDLAGMLTKLEEGDVLFIDEIHRLRPQIEEILYPAMEDYQLDIIIGEGPGARSVKLSLPPFTLVGATTRTGLLTSPLRDRFGISQRLDFYSAQELARIVVRSAKLLGVAAEEEGAAEIAQRARGTPRIANRLLRRVRDYAEVKDGSGTVTSQVAGDALDMLRVDRSGLDHLDRRLLQVLMDTFGGGPVGIDSLAASLGEERDILEDVLEPFLIQQGYIARTARGRIAAPAAYTLFGLPIPQEQFPRAPGLPLSDPKP